MSDQWYWNNGTNIYGPLDSAAVVSKIRDGQIVPTHQVKVGTGDWTSAVSVVTAVQNGEQIDTTTAAEESLAKLRHAGVKVNTNTTPESFFGRVSGWLLDLVSSTVSAIANSIGFLLEQCWTKAGKLILCGVMLSIAFLLFMRMSSWSEPSAERVANELTLALLQINELREKEADDSEWDLLQEEVLSEIGPLVIEMDDYHNDNPTNVGRMSSDARARAVIRRHVISAGKHCLPRILADIRNDNDPVIAQFEFDIDAIRKHLAGVEAIPLSLADAKKRRRDLVRQERQWEAKTRFIRELDPTTSAIILADVALLIVGFGYFVRRKRSKKK